MATMALDLSRFEEMERLVDEQTTPPRPTMWGGTAEDTYEKGWSSQLDNQTPVLVSDATAWYFESEADEIDDPGARPGGERRARGISTLGVSVRRPISV